jgi:hypothetical protein
MRSLAPPRPPSHRLASLRFVLFAGLGLTAVATTGCGHPATREECEAIFRRSAEIELQAQNVTDPKIIAERLDAVRAARGDELVKQCTGKRITSRALACVQAAQTATEVDRCLD